MNNRMIYAAYGSNLDLDRMSIRCPGAKICGTAELKDYQLVFRGKSKNAVATVEPKTGGTVPILLWEISQRDEKALDQYADWPGFYRKETMDFQMGHQTVQAMIYVMAPGYPSGYPSWMYFDTLVAGYLRCGFDPGELGKAMERSGEQMRLEQAAVRELTVQF